MNKKTEYGVNEKIFWRYVDKTEDGCWLWTHWLTEKGYGQLDRGRRAHRVAWMLTNGPIPEGAMVLHKTHCTSRACVNPDHLYLGDAKQNAADREELGRTHRPAGEMAPNVRLTWEKVRAIRERYRSREATPTELADEYGVAVPTVWNIIYGRTWKE